MKIISILAIFAILVLLAGSIGINHSVDAKRTKIINLKPQDKPKNLGNLTNTTVKPSNLSDQKQICASSDYVSFKNQLDTASKKITTLKESLYKNPQSAQSPEQAKAIADKLNGSPEMQNYLQLQKKYDLLYSTCASNSNTIPIVPKKVCTDTDYSTAQKNITDIDKRHSELKLKYLSEGKSAVASGQYSGTVEQYAQDKLANSDEVKSLQENRQKYELTTRDCQQNYLPRSYNAQSENACPQSDIDKLKTMLTDLEKRLADIKEKTNPQWRELHDSGKVKEDWPEYANKIVSASPEFSQYQQLQQKLDALNKMCNAIRNPNPPQNTEPICSDDAKKAKQLLGDAQNKYSSLKTKYYEDWKSQSQAGTYSGTWEQFAQEKFLMAQEVIDINQLITKYSAQAQECFTINPTSKNKQ